MPNAAKVEALAISLEPVMAVSQLSHHQRALAAQRRANGAKSKGPVTVAGKARAAGNATRHGLTADLVRDPDERRRLQARSDDLAAEFQPATPFEAALVERLASARAGSARMSAWSVAPGSRARS